MRCVCSTFSCPKRDGSWYGSLSGEWALKGVRFPRIPLKKMSNPSLPTPVLLSFHNLHSLLQLNSSFGLGKIEQDTEPQKLLPILWIHRYVALDKSICPKTNYNCLQGPDRTCSVLPPSRGQTTYHGETITLPCLSIEPFHGRCFDLSKQEKH